MTLYQFNLLDELEQWQVVWDLTPIAKRMDGSNRYDLYAVDGFHVEVRYIMPDNIIYPSLLQHITQYEGDNVKRFWIIYAPKNKSSLKGIVKSGFECVKLYA